LGDQDASHNPKLVENTYLNCLCSVRTISSGSGLPTVPRTFGGEISDRKGGMTQRPSPAASPLKNLDKDEWNISMKWNMADLPTIRTFTLSAKCKHQRPDKVPRRCQLHTRSAPTWVHDLLRQEAAYEASSDKYRGYLNAYRLILVQLRVDKRPSTNDPETRVRHRHAELTTILPDSCTFTGHSRMDLIQFSNSVAELEIRSERAGNQHDSGLT
jgi:hypothetical protein